MFTYFAICDVPEQALLHVTALLRAYRREIGTRRETPLGYRACPGDAGVVVVP